MINSYIIEVKAVQKKFVLLHLSGFYDLGI